MANCRTCKHVHLPGGYRAQCKLDKKEIKRDVFSPYYAWGTLFDNGEDNSPEWCYLKRGKKAEKTNEALRKAEEERRERQKKRGQEDALEGRPPAVAEWSYIEGYETALAVQAPKRSRS